MPLPTTPVAVPHRPYAIYPATNLMNTDGFFVVNMGGQHIEAQFVNQAAAPLTNLRVYIEGVSDPGVVVSPVIRGAPSLPAGASVALRFYANFTLATPGCTWVSFIIEADGHVLRRVLKKIFVTRVDYHKPTKTYSVVMPQGTMEVRIHRAMVGPRENFCRGKGPFIALPQDVSYSWVPTPPYAGTHGPFPYEDPWWKIALAILAALLLLGGALYDYFSDDELDGGSVSVSGTFEETDPSVSCCTSVGTSASSGEDDWVARGLYSAAGAAASIAIASDGPDLHYRGQDGTPPPAGALTERETVRLKIHYPVAPSPGRKYPIEGSWQYQRDTTAGSLTFAASDQRENLHYLASYEVKAPAVHDRMKGPLVVCARFQRPDGKYFTGGDLYVSAVLVSTYGQVRQFVLGDHGIWVDREANDGWYCGGYQFRASSKLSVANLEGDPPGDWYLFVLAQDVNTVRDGTAPFDAAHVIGGLMLTNQFDMQFDQPCRLNHDAVIHVV